MPQDMKLIMENWRGNFLTEIDTDPTFEKITVQEFLNKFGKFNNHSAKLRRGLVKFLKEKLSHAPADSELAKGIKTLISKSAEVTSANAFKIVAALAVVASGGTVAAWIGGGAAFATALSGLLTTGAAGAGAGVFLVGLLKSYLKDAGKVGKNEFGKLFLSLQVADGSCAPDDDMCRAFDLNDRLEKVLKGGDQGNTPHMLSMIGEFIMEIDKIHQAILAKEEEITNSVDTDQHAFGDLEHFLQQPLAEAFPGFSMRTSNKISQHVLRGVGVDVGLRNQGP